MGRAPCGRRAVRVACRDSSRPAPRGPALGDAEQPKDHEDDHNDEQRVYPSAAVPGSGDGGPSRVPAAAAEVSEEPEQQQHDDEQLDETHTHLLAVALSGLDDQDLVIAARLLAGAPFPRKDERVLSVGWSALADVLLERSGKTADDMRESYHGMPTSATWRPSSSRARRVRTLRSRCRTSRRSSTPSPRYAEPRRSAISCAGCCAARMRERRATS